jgi:hypothetical protein
MQPDYLTKSKVVQNKIETLRRTYAGAAKTGKLMNSAWSRQQFEPLKLAVKLIELVQFHSSTCRFR